MSGILGIVLGLLLLIYLSYKGFAIIWVAPVSSLVVALVGFGFSDKLLYSYLGYANESGALVGYMPELANFVRNYFALFFLGAVFGKLMDITGAAKSVALLLSKLFGAKRAMMAVIVGCGALTYGGVSLFVVVFAIYPLAIVLFRESNLPRRLIPGAIALGAFTFSMTALPGSPQLNNIIAGQNFGTDPYAAPVLGIVSAGVMFLGGYLYMLWKQKKVLAKGEHFTEPLEFVAKIDDSDLPGAFLSLLPLVGVVVTLYIYTKVLHFGTTPGTVLALLSGNIITVLVNIGRFSKPVINGDGKPVNFLLKALTEGGNGAVVAILNTAAAVGFGGVVKAVPAFATLRDLLLGIKASPLISEGIAVTLLAGATGSSSGGMGIVLPVLAPEYLKTGINPQILHRVATVASGGLDSLPHCGAVLTLLAVCGMTHKDSYNDIGMVTCVLPLLALVVIIVLGAMGIA